MTSDVIVEHGAKKAYKTRDYVLWSVQFCFMLMRLKKTKSNLPETPYEHEGYKTAFYYSSDLVRCDHKVWTNDSTIQFGIHFLMSSYANKHAMMITPCSLTVLKDKRRELTKEDYQETLKSTAKKCMKSFDAEIINFSVHLSV